MDKISDFLTKIRNAFAAGHSQVIIPLSRKSKMVTNILIKEKIFSASSEEEAGLTFVFNPELKKLTLKRISKPGRKVYYQKNDLYKTSRDLGFKIISTSSSAMTDSQARQKGVGGEVICQVIPRFNQGN